MLWRQGGDTADSELGPLVKVRLGVVGEAGGGTRAVSTAAVRGRAVVSTATLGSLHLHKLNSHLVFSYKGPQFSALSSSFSSVVEVTGFRNAPPDGGTIFLEHHVTWRFESGFIHLHYLLGVLTTQTYLHYLKAGLFGIAVKLQGLTIWG